ncbi:hypothetical protein E2C01_054532 [Portunus trituberculatus]|uniref:Uncharacterized protein n=1 Tax=Portunus trituberculatus TaxID=210409 RepID=A0A5B7GTG9_PORTR|nr:hypothetical protein [Portunus trituberculatus]
MDIKTMTRLSFPLPALHSDALCVCKTGSGQGRSMAAVVVVVERGQFMVVGVRAPSSLVAQIFCVLLKLSNKEHLWSHGASDSIITSTVVR